ncbi:MAG: ABC transporter ATP-binding protein [Mycoplasmataceae bacterium]|jgi:ABC-type multidrug transport system ATPase subunit|nr:ABC transporter ATP-binding protein [Mycoplasmataceae bacterium]
MLEIKNLSRDFGHKQVLKNISFMVGAGQIHALLGHNGAGKTTLIKIILGFLRPSSGGVYVNNMETWGEKTGILARNQIGVLFENNGLFSNLTAMENLEVIARIYKIDTVTWKNRADRLLEIVGLDNDKKEQVRNWSAGMKRKLALIRTLIHNPPLILLDEPTTGLDAESKKSIRLLILEEQKQKKAFLIATQDLLDIDRVASHTTLFYKGEILFTGTVHSLKNKLPLYKFRFDSLVDYNEFISNYGYKIEVIDTENDQFGVTVLVKSEPHNNLREDVAKFSAYSIPITLEDVYVNFSKNNL